MNCPECIRHLDDYADGELSADAARAVETHLAGCANCQAQLAALRELRRATAALPREIEPARDLWPELHAALHGDSSAAHATSADGQRGSKLGRRTAWPSFVPFAVAAAIVFAAVLTRRDAAPAGEPRGWAVASVSGSPRIGTRAVRGQGELRLGQWLETDAASEARLAVGSIGEVSVGPSSRLRLMDTAATAHRLELARGTLHARIWAPPRLFFVDTPSATAIDLGCAYTLTVADDGSGELHVQTGYVALEHAGREAIIPAGAMCRTRRNAGPGTPFAEDASPALQASLDHLDFAARADDAALSTVLMQARAEDAITLWHLLARTEGRQRAAVFDTLARLHAPPAEVTRAGILAGDEAMRRAWGIELGLGTLAVR